MTIGSRGQSTQRALENYLRYPIYVPTFINKLTAKRQWTYDLVNYKKLQMLL